MIFWFSLISKAPSLLRRVCWFWLENGISGLPKVFRMQLAEVGAVASATSMTHSCAGAGGGADDAAAAFRLCTRRAQKPFWSLLLHEAARQNSVERMKELSVGRRACLTPFALRWSSSSSLMEMSSNVQQDEAMTAALTNTVLPVSPFLPSFFFGCTSRSCSTSFVVHVAVGSAWHYSAFCSIPSSTVALLPHSVIQSGRSQSSRSLMPINLGILQLSHIVAYDV